MKTGSDAIVLPSLMARVICHFHVSFGDCYCLWWWLMNATLRFGGCDGRG